MCHKSTKQKQFSQEGIYKKLTLVIRGELPFWEGAPGKCPPRVRLLPGAHKKLAG